MNILFIKKKCCRIYGSEIPRVSVFWHCPYSVNFPYIVSTRYYLVQWFPDFFFGDPFLFFFIKRPT